MKSTPIFGVKKMTFLILPPITLSRIEIDGDLSSEGHQGSDMIYRTRPRRTLSTLTPWQAARVQRDKVPYDMTGHILESFPLFAWMFSPI